MGDDASRAGASRPDWTVSFSTKLCVIAWIGMAFAEVLPVGYTKYGCILFGSHAAALAMLTCLIAWPLRQKAALFLLLIASAPPTLYFATVLWNIGRRKGWIA